MGISNETGFLLHSIACLGQYGSEMEQGKDKHRDKLLD